MTLESNIFHFYCCFLEMAHTLSNSGENQIAMQQVIIKQITDEEIYLQREIKHRLEAAILTENMTILSELLHPRGVFFGKFSRGQAMVYLIKKFDKLKRKPGRDNMNINHGFSFDHFPKQDVIEFRFSVWGSDFTVRDFTPPEFGLPKRPEFDEGITRLALEFKDDKIYSIRHPKKVIRDFVEIARRN